MENAKNTIQNLPWKKIAIGTGIGLTGVLIGMYAFNRCAKQGGQQQQQKGQQAAAAQQKQVATSQQKQGGQQKQAAAQQQVAAQQKVGGQQQVTGTQQPPASQQKQVPAQQNPQHQQMTTDDQPPPLEQIGQMEYHNWNAGNRPANLGHGYTDVSNYYRYNPTGQELPSLHQQESRLMNDGYGTAQFIHEEGEDEMKIGEMKIGNQAQPRNVTGINAVVMDASLDINPVIRPTGESAPGQMDNFWQNEGPLNFQEQQL
uniref:Uncharacterized protein n=1 Tax=Clandestinovirus TaxID=2831644 RepID=A0A8F8KPC5_9VIRU|nr:hypothetical protein KOM_12_538 [Clandestinovirus]